MLSTLFPFITSKYRGDSSKTYYIVEYLFYYILLFYLYHLHVHKHIQRIVMWLVILVKTSDCKTLLQRSQPHLKASNVNATLVHTYYLTNVLPEHRT